MTTVETARLLLRPWQPDDLERLVRLYADPQVARYVSRDGQPIPRQRSVPAFEHFVEQWERKGYGPWAAVDKHRCDETLAADQRAGARRRPAPAVGPGPVDGHALAVGRSSERGGPVGAGLRRVHPSG